MPCRDRHSTASRSTELPCFSRALVAVIVGALVWTVGSAETRAETPTGTVAVSKAIQGGLTAANAGSEFTYLINYAYASTIQAGKNIVLTDNLDADLSWVGAEVILGTTPHIASTSYDSASGKATWTFVDPLPAGSSGQITLRVRFPLGTTLPGTVAVNTATIDGDNTEPATSDEVSVSAKAECRWVANVTGPAAAAIGQNVTYVARVDRPNPTTANLNVTAGTVSLTLPEGVLPDDVVSASGGAMTGTGTAGDPVIVSWTGITATASGTAGGAGWSQNLVIRHDPARFAAGQVVTVGEVMNLTVVGGTVCGGADSQITTLGDFAPAPDGAALKGQSTTMGVLLSSQTFYYTLDADSTGNVPLDSFTISDDLPQNFALSSVRLPTVNNGPGGNFITLFYRRSDTGATEYTWPGSPFAAATTTLHLKSLDLPSGVYVSAVRFEFGDRPADFGIATAIRLSGTLIETGWGSPATTIATGDAVCNTMTFTADYAGANAVTRTSTGCVTVIVPTVRPAVAKSVVAGNAVMPGQTTTWQVEISNSSTATVPMVNPMGMDLLPAQIEYVDGSFAPRADGTFNSSSAAEPLLEVIPNHDGTGRTLLRWSYAHTFPINTRSTVQFRTRVKDGTAAGSASNRGYVSVNPEDQPGPVVYRTNPEPDANDLNNDGNASDLRGRTGNVTITVSPSAALDSLKLVKGQLDTDWSRYPDFGHTSPGGTADYRLVVRNSGNVALKDIVVVDILPAAGDTAVTTTTPRDTEWSPFLAGPVSAPSGVTVYYSTEPNPDRPEMGVTTHHPPNWTAVPPPDITTVRSLKFDFGSIVLGGADELELRWPMRVPVDAPTTDEVAWNSFGVVATRNDNRSLLLPTEPIKVGIAVEPIKPAASGNLVWADLDRNGIQEAGEPGLDGVRVELYRDNGDATADPTTDELVGFTLSAGCGQYLFSFLPPGDYYTVFFPPPAYLASPKNQGANPDADSDGSPATVRGLPARITELTSLVSGEIDLTWDQGFYQPPVSDAPIAAVGNYVWYDQNSNGIQDEPAANGLNGVTVELYASAGTLAGTRTTANDVNGNPGYYLFDGLTPGSYSLKFLPPSGFALTASEQGDDTAADSDADTASGHTTAFTLVGGQYDTTRDAGLALPTGPLSLGDRIWEDTNGNGLYEPGSGESGVNGVKLNLYRDLDANGIFNSAQDQFFATTTTFTQAGTPGFYRFENLPEGGVIVQVDPANFASGGPLAGFISTSGNGTAPDPDDDANDDDNGESMAGQGVVSQAISLMIGGEPGLDGDSNANVTLDFGFVRPATIGDWIWLDTDADGLQDPEEPGFNGVTVNLYRPGYGPDGLAGSADDADVVATQVTANDGAMDGICRFIGLHPGTYRLEVVTPGTHALSPQDQGADDEVDSDAFPANGTMAATLLGSGESDLTWDAGLFTPYVTIDATSYCDRDAPWVSYTVTAYGFTPSLATIEWLDAADAVVQALDNQPLSGNLLWPGASVDSSGSGLAWPGWELVGGRWVETASSVRPSAKLRITVNPTAEVTVTYPPATPECAPEPRVSVGNLIFRDEDSNGRFDAGTDTGIDGVSVELWNPGSDAAAGGDDDALIATTTTSGGGWYLFSSLPPDSYYVRVPASQFVSGQPLAGMSSSPGAGADSTTDHSTDENGVDDSTPETDGVWSNVIAVQATLAPTGETGPAAGSADQSSNLTLDLGFVPPAPPTAARVAHFRAVSVGEGLVELAWTTLIEYDVLGFHIDRSMPDGSWQRLTTQMIAATGGDGRPQTYGLMDANVPAAGRLVYRLLETDLEGRHHVLASTTLEAPRTTGIIRTPAGLSLDLRGTPNTTVTVESAESIDGPWTRIQPITLDPTGTGRLSIGVNLDEPARFYRVQNGESLQHLLRPFGSAL